MVSPARPPAPRPGRARASEREASAWAPHPPRRSAPCIPLPGPARGGRLSGTMTNPAAAQSQDIDCLSPEAQRLAEARLAAKRAARAEAREIRMKELERQQKEIYQVQKKYYGLESKWGHIEQWMEDSERYSHRPRTTPLASEEDELLSVGSRGSRLQPDLEFRGPYSWTNGHDAESYAAQALPSRRPVRPSEHGGHLNSCSRASSARASPLVEERPDKDFAEKGARNLPGLSAATLASLGGTSSRRGSGDTSVSLDTEASIREMKDLSDLRDQVQDVEGRCMQGLREMKDSLVEAEDKYRKAMVSNAQLDNEKTNFMYQVDALKDLLLELEEQLAEAQRQHEDKSRVRAPRAHRRAG
ncbi:leucine-rich repeat flightless-interacting protein 1-like, partial [Erinaceus europaeus]|uniref:Leucine-rich repeat flightless-interacting protein 1-like n=1 Tax=Erinaceus europaeus TaxID=9365 RepID=A0ABM3WVU0_ERIEU